MTVGGAWEVGHSDARTGTIVLRGPNYGCECRCQLPTEGIHIWNPERTLDDATRECIARGFARVLNGVLGERY